MDNTFFTISELADKFQVPIAKIELWLQMSKAQMNGNRYSCEDLCSWLDLRKIRG